MSDMFLSEIRMMSFGLVPSGWALCNGQLLPIAQNQALFSLLGTTYGGDGRVNFALPDLRGRVPTHTGGIGHFLGERGGEQSHTLSIAEIPQHTHTLNGSNTQGNSANPAFGGVGNVLAQDPGNAYAPGFNPGSAALNAGSLANVGGSQAHENMQPYLTVNFCIALQGIFPSQS
jgi:microcystin-dependent protein